MKKAFLLLLLLVNIASTSPNTALPVVISTTATPPARSANASLSLYNQMKLAGSGLKEDVFEYAMRGWQKMGAAKPVLSIVDLSQPSNKKRLYVVDLLNKKLLFNTYVSHGRNSGDLLAKQFSNTQSSFQTSLGFYQTLNTYMGKHGLSLQLKGLEKGFNDNAYNRNIVLHGADYVCEDFIRKTGRLGRSQGCPAIPYAESKGIIQAVKGGTCLFVYSPNANYLKQSALLVERVHIFVKAEVSGSVNIRNVVSDENGERLGHFKRLRLLIDQAAIHKTGIESLLAQHQVSQFNRFLNPNATMTPPAVGCDLEQIPAVGIVQIDS